MSQDSTGVYVISLDSSLERQRRFAEMSIESSLDWTFFSAYRASEPPLRYDEKLSIERFGRPLTSGEIGTYTSHYKVWQKFFESDYDQVIVLEDDVLVDWPMLNELAKLDFREAGIDFLRLFSTHPFKFETAVYRFCSPHSHLVRCKGLILGIQAYVLSKRGAEALLGTGTTIFEPVDWVMSRYWRYRVVNYCLFPFPVLERHIPSTIGSSRELQHKTGLAEKARRLGWRLHNRLSREYADRVLFKENPFPKSEDVGASYIATFESENTRKNSSRPRGK